jgi:uncharacterized membrane protein YczE
MAFRERFRHREPRPVPVRKPWPFWPRFVQLQIGLLLYGVSAAMLVRSRLGLDPWDVFHQGLARQTGLSIGTWVILVGFAVLLLWIPLRQRPGIGTVSNVFLIGVWLDLTLHVLPDVHVMAARVALMVGGIVLCGLATGLYIGAAMGPGPRDGLMVGIANRGHSIRVVRTSIEVLVLIVGWLLGGTVGVGTVLYALTIGLIAHVTIPAFSRGPVLRERLTRRGPTTAEAAPVSRTAAAPSPAP